MSESTVAGELFLGWLNDTHDTRFPPPDADADSTLVVAGDTRLAMEVRPLLGAVEDPRWRPQIQRIETMLAHDLPGAYALWVPFGAVPPSEEPALSEFIDAVRQAALKLGPHERSYVPLPIRLTLRKITAEGGVVSVTGGLNQHWARFTEHVRGTYDLDSTPLHRLPDSDAHLDELIATIVDASRTLEAGSQVAVDTIDAWTLQRLSSPRGNTAGFVTILGSPPTQTDDPGLTVRRNFRRILAEAGPALRSAEASTRALVLLGHYARMDHEGATTAMRGYDPTLYSGIDYVALVADGLVKPIIDSPVAAGR
jgi:hypothetical protein